MLADDIGWRSHLKVIQLVNTGYEIGVVIGDAVVCVRAEEQGFRWFCACLSRSHICPKREDARLWVMPARLVQFYVELKCGCFVGARRPYLIAIIVDAGLGIRRARLSRQTIQNKVSGCTIRLKARMQTLLVVLHRGDFNCASCFRDRLCDSGYKHFAEIETGFDVLGGAA